MEHCLTYLGNAVLRLYIIPFCSDTVFIRIIHLNVFDILTNIELVVNSIGDNVSHCNGTYQTALKRFLEWGKIWKTWYSRSLRLNQIRICFFIIC